MGRIVLLLVLLLALLASPALAEPPVWAVVTDAKDLAPDVRLPKGFSFRREYLVEVGGDFVPPGCCLDPRREKGRLVVDARVRVEPRPIRPQDCNAGQYDAWRRCHELADEEARFGPRPERAQRWIPSQLVRVPRGKRLLVVGWSDEVVVGEQGVIARRTHRRPPPPITPDPGPVRSGPPSPMP